MKITEVRICTRILNLQSSLYPDCLAVKTYISSVSAVTRLGYVPDNSTERVGVAVTFVLIFRRYLARL